MSLINFKKIKKLVLPAFMLVILLFLATLAGCGMRASNSGGACGRVVDAEGKVVVNARVASIFDENQIIYSDLSGGFVLSNLSAGLHNIVITHKDFDVEQCPVEVANGKMSDMGMIKLSNISLSDKISDVKTEKIASTTADISWKTDKERVCSLIYGLDFGDYDKTLKENRASKEHTLTISGLLPETLYHYRICFDDESENTFNSYDYSFMTTEPDRPMKPTYVKVKPLTSLKNVTVVWNAPELKKSVAGYNVYRKNKLVNRNELTDWIKLNETVLDAKTFEFTDITAESGMFNRYAVVAVNSFGAESEKEISEMVFTSGVINSETILTADDSPVKIYADLVVAAGTNLIIEAGTELLIAEKDSFVSGLDEERVEILVYGQITINGTSDEPVVFAPLNGSGRRDHWAGIKIITDSQLVSRVSHTQLFGCSGYALDAKAKGVAIDNLAVFYSNGGINLEGVVNVLNLESCLFSEISLVAINIKDCNRVNLINSRINGAAVGIVSDNSSSNHQTIIKNTDIYASKVGIRGFFGKVSVLNSLIVCKEGTGIICENALSEFGNYIDHLTIDALNGIEVMAGNFNITNNIIDNTVSSGNNGIINKTADNPVYNFNNIHGFANSYVGCQKGYSSNALAPNFVGGNPYDYNLPPTSILLFADEYQKELGKYGVTRY